MIPETAIDWKNGKVAQARDRRMPGSCLWIIGLMDCWSDGVME